MSRPCLVALVAMDRAARRRVVLLALDRAHRRVHGLPLPGMEPYRPNKPRAAYSVVAPVKPDDLEACFG